MIWHIFEIKKYVVATYWYWYLEQNYCHKYLKNRSLEHWIRARIFYVNGTLYFWNGFIRIFEWITCQLGWRVGNGLNIKVGVEPIAGPNSLHLLSKELRDYLNGLGISFLAQAQNLDVCDSEGPKWYSATDLLLGGDWAAQWCSYVKGLTHGGIRIGNAEDKLLWMYDDNKKSL